MSRHELELQKKIVSLINAMGGRARICTQTPYTTVGDPDIYACYLGRMLQLEVKVESEMPTGIQVVRMREWQDAGAQVHVVRSIHEVQLILRMCEEL